MGLGCFHWVGSAAPPRGLQGALISNARLGSHTLRLPGPEASSPVTCLPRGCWGWRKGAQRVGALSPQHPLLLPPGGPFLPSMPLLTHRRPHPSMSLLPLPSPTLSGDTPPRGVLSCGKPLSRPWGLTLSRHGPLPLRCPVPPLTCSSLLVPPLAPRTLSPPRPLLS